jgi:hypothetical protein
MYHCALCNSSDGSAYKESRGYSLLHSCESTTAPYALPSALCRALRTRAPQQPPTHIMPHGQKSITQPQHALKCLLLPRCKGRKDAHDAEASHPPLHTMRHTVTAAAAGPAMAAAPNKETPITAAYAFTPKEANWLQSQM